MSLACVFSSKYKPKQDGTSGLQQHLEVSDEQAITSKFLQYADENINNRCSDIYAFKWKLIIYPQKF